jgi:[ribosomal protein S18]-alanine N-acetyltransferase
LSLTRCGGITPFQGYRPTFSRYPGLRPGLWNHAPSGLPAALPHPTPVVKTNSLFFSLRAILRRDMPALLTIERASFTAPWREADFENALRRPCGFGLTAEFNGDVCGYLIGNVNGGRVNLCNLCVAPRTRRRGVATALVRAVTRELRRRQRLVTLVGERNVRAQIFFRSQGFRVVTIEHNYWPASGDDAYHFEYRPGV